MLFEWVQECVDACSLLFLEVVFYDLPLPGKNDGICLLGNFVVFENEVHTDTMELRVVFQNVWFTPHRERLVVVCIGPFRLGHFVNYQFIWFLLRNLILACDDTKVLLVWAESHGDDLVLVTTLVLHQFHINFSIFYFLPGLRVIHLNLIII